MKDHLKKPFIITLGEYSNERTNISDTGSNQIDCTKNNFKKRRTLQHRDKTFNSIYMTSECDDELKNDFNWLINFNLKEILKYDIDEEFHESKMFKRQKKCPSKENIDKHEHRISVVEIIEQCLIENEGVTVRDINKWISKQFPRFKSKDCKWKNFVRKTLLKNPCFKKRKFKRGKSDLWYLDRNYFRDSQCSKSNPQQKIEPTIKESNLIKRGTSQKPKSTRELPPVVKCIKECITLDDNILYTPVISDIPAGPVELYSSATWMEPIEFQDKNLIEVEEPIECYELQSPLHAEFLDENGEPLQVHFLDENNTPIPIELI